MTFRHSNFPILIIAIILFATNNYFKYEKNTGTTTRTTSDTPFPNIGNPKNREPVLSQKGLTLCDRLIHNYSQIGELTNSPYKPRRDQTDFRLLSDIAPHELVRRTRFINVPELKYPLIRVDEIITQTPGNPERRLATLASIADHLITRIAGETNIKSVQSKLPEGFAIRKSMSSEDLFLVSFPLTSHSSEDEAIASLEKMDGSIIHAEPDFLVSPTTLPNDSFTDELYAFENTGQNNGLAGADISAAEAWDITTGDGSAIIAIIDTGIDPTHPDLAPSLFVNPGESGNGRENNGIDDDENGFIDDVSGWDFAANDNNPRDEHFHGTHVAGIAGATGNNKIGVSGVCWDVRLLNLRFINANNMGTTSDAIDAVNYATEIGADITNNSWGGIGISVELRRAIRRGGDAGILFVAAAGNTGQNSDEIPRYPASYPSEYIISVAATDNRDQLTSFSNRGRRSVDIAAPGSNILSTFPTYQTPEMEFARFSSNYETISGTSMACPMVAGAAALLKMHRPDIGVIALREALLSSVDPIELLSEDTSSGGRLNLATLLSPFSRGTERQSQVAAGENHFLKINPDGTVLIWGDGKPVPEIIPGLSGIVEVAAGKNFSVALSELGNVFTFGEAGGSGQMGNGFLMGNREPGLVQNLPEIVQISVGTAHVLALSRAGDVWAWGRGIFGILGNEAEDLSAIPVKVNNLDDAVFVSAGSYHNLAIREDGTVVSWGYNGTGALGDGTTLNRNTPVTVLGLNEITQVSASRGTRSPGADPKLFGGHSLAVSDNGDVFSFGNNRFGELGRLSISDGSQIALLIPDLNDITSVSAGQWVSYAVDTNGNSYSFGLGSLGQLGDGTIGSRSTPTRIATVQGALQLAATTNASAAALMTDGRVFTWGSNREGALGNGVNPSITYRPVDVGLSGITSIAAGENRSSFLLEDSSLWEAGNSPTAKFVNESSGADLFHIVTKTTFENAQSAVGLSGDTAIYHRADGTVWRNFFAASRQVENLIGVQQVVAAGSHGIARLADGALASFGWDATSNSSGQLGLGTNTPPTTPFAAIPIPDLNNIAGIATSASHTLAFREDGTLLAWGENASSQLGTSDTQARFSPTTISGIRNVIAVSAGTRHSLAVTSTGEVYSWGDNQSGQLGLGDLQNRTTPTKIPLPNRAQVTSVAAGERHSLILLKNGRLLACGENGNGQLGTGSTTRSTAPTPVSSVSDVIEIAAGRAHSIARLSNGRARAWGDNSLGQVGSGESIARSPLRIIDHPNSITTERVYSLAAANGTSWKIDFFSETQLQNDSISGDNADPDGDGYPNLIEYATGGNPLIPDTGLITSGLEKISDSATTTSTGLGVEPGQIHLFIELSLAQPDTECLTEISEDLINWIPLEVATTNSIIIGDRLKIYDDIPISSDTPTRFMRCRIIRRYY